MSVYEQYIGQRVKIVWLDSDRQKAVIGILIDFDKKFLTVRADRDNNLISVTSDSVAAISEHKGYSNVKP